MHRFIPDPDRPGRDWPEIVNNAVLGAEVIGGLGALAKTVYDNAPNPGQVGQFMRHVTQQRHSQRSALQNEPNISPKRKMTSRRWDEESNRNIARDPRQGLRFSDPGDGDTNMGDSKEPDANEGNQVSTNANRFSSGEGAQTRGYEETPITRVLPTYGVQETHTTVLPMTSYGSCTLLDHNSPVALEYRMNSVYGIILHSINTPTASTPYTKGVFNKIALGSASSWPSTLKDFPKAPTTTEYPAWRDYWDTLYEVYTVLGCHWTLTVQNVTAQQGGDVMCGVQYQGYGASSTGQVPPNNAPLNQTFSWKNLNYTVCKATRSQGSDNDGFTVIQGTWRPGKAKKNVTNDDDVKTWTKVGADPSFKEDLVLWFYKGPFHPDTSGNPPNVNYQLQLKWIVQYKDLKQQARYPTDGLVDIQQALPSQALEI